MSLKSKKEKIGMFDNIALLVTDEWVEIHSNCECGNSLRMLVKKTSYENEHVRYCMVCGKRCRYGEIK